MSIYFVTYVDILTVGDGLQTVNLEMVNPALLLDLQKALPRPEKIKYVAMPAFVNPENKRAELTDPRATTMLHFLGLEGHGIRKVSGALTEPGFDQNQINRLVGHLLRNMTDQSAVILVSPRVATRYFREPVDEAVVRRIRAGERVKSAVAAPQGGMETAILTDGEMAAARKQVSDIREALATAQYSIDNDATVEISGDQFDALQLLVHQQARLPPSPPARPTRTWKRLVMKLALLPAVAALLFFLLRAGSLL